MNGEPIQTLIGAQLTSVEFVQDYVQLRFDGPVLTVNAPFQILVQDRAYEKGSTGYRDALCERIGCHVQRAFTIPEQQLAIEFDGNSKLAISLKSEDQISPEAAILTQGATQICVW